MDLEASEIMIRSAMHRVGAVGITPLLQFPVPSAEQRTLPCSCGHTAHYQELRSKSVLTAVGPVEVSRPYYLCRHCHNGRFPVDVELDIENMELSPGVRRMQATVGQGTAFDHGRQQIKLLADLGVTTKSVERRQKLLGPTLRRVSREKSGAPYNWICRSCWASQFPSCMCKWMGLAFR
jgi:hypothetical protein